MNTIKETTHTQSAFMVGEVVGLTHRGEGIVSIANGNGSKKKYVVKNVYPQETIAVQKIQSSRMRKSKTLRAWRLLWTPWKKIKPFCGHFEICGGCSMQELSYSDQLVIKATHVRSLLSPLLAFNITVKKAEGQILSGIRYYYRNKVDYTFGAKKWLETASKHKEIQDNRGAGFHVRGFYDRVVHITQCFLHQSNELRRAVHRWAIDNNIEYYNSRSQEGWLRTLTIRNNLKGEYLLIFSVTSENVDLIDDIGTLIKEQFEYVVSMFVVINIGHNDSIQNIEHKKIFGKDYLIEECAHIHLKIYPQVFYQTNSLLTPRLYGQVIEMAQLQKTDKVLDLYCGIGSIGLFLAHKVESVLGVEMLEKAVEVARKNALLNKIDNISFISGTVEKILKNSQYYIVEKKFDVIIVDPPRAGLHPNVIKYLLNSGVARIVYVSCNPTSLAHDISMLSEQYNLMQWQAIDMFPHTYHVETVVLLICKE